MAGGPNPSPGERLRRTLDDVGRDELLTATLRSHLADLDALTRNVSPEQFEAAVAVLAPSPVSCGGASARPPTSPSTAKS